MSEPKRETSLDFLYPPFRAKVEAAMKAVAAVHVPGVTRWAVGETYRTPARQKWLYAQGRTRPGNVVTHAQTSPYHGRGLAVDLWPVDAKGAVPWGNNAAWEAWADAAEAQGLEAGWHWASFKDGPHVQCSAGQFNTWQAPAEAHVKKVLAGAKKALPPVSVTVSGVRLSVPVEERGNALYAPLRGLLEALGYTVEYDPQARAVTARKGEG